MLNEIYLDRACCDELDISYSDPKQGDVVVLKPSVALLLRSDWDKHHRSTFHEFIFAERDMRLEPSFVKYEGSAFHRPGWYKILNPPNTRHFVKVDIDTELLRKQRDLLLEISDELRESDVRLLSGVIVMLDHMLDQAET
tara:strand:- start:98 stop:517 length:420 start_codon:yes stop_codon:yes gene_type:complete